VKLKFISALQISVKFQQNKYFLSMVAKEIRMIAIDKLECVDMLCYLGDMIGTGGEAEEALQVGV